MSNDESIFKWLSIVMRNTHKHINHQMDDLKIGRGQHQYLLTLYHHNGVSQEELSKMLGIDKGTTARAVKKLVDNGYISREVDENDKRAFKLYVTEKAEGYRTKFFEIADEWEATLLEGISEEHRQIIKTAMMDMGKIAIDKVKEET
ncbi:MAG: MarR family transcriptional regulator [Clostridiales bacterium]|nr:MarR family transcriptional regulator [Clostridiales bacterium]